MSITTASQSQLGQDTAKNSQVVTTVVKNFTSGTLSSGASGPSVSSIIVTDSGYNSLDETAAATSNSYIRILGTGFESTANVFLNGTMVPKANITFVSSSELRAVLPVSNTGNYAVGVFNSNSAGALYSSSFSISTMPQWLTASPLANVVANIAFSTALSATSDSNITYSNTTALPAGTTLAANGLFSGTISVGVNTSYSFDVKATDAELQDTTKTFSLTAVIPALSGALWGWGNDFHGQIGLNRRNTYSYSPAQVGSQTDWAYVFPGPDWTHAIKPNGTLWNWGRNNDSTSGTGISTVTRSSPTQVGTLTDWSPNFSNGSHHVLATKTDGTLWSWGRNDGGQLGSGGQSSRNSPGQVGSDTNWSKVAAGLHVSTQFGAASLAIKTNGTLWAWGKNNFGQLGINSSVNSYVFTITQVGPNTTWANISTSAHTLAVRTDGTLWSWGRNDYGQLGLSNRTYRSSPVQIGTDTNWSKVTTGAFHSFAIKTNGTLWAWGSRDTGSLGDGSNQHRSSPVQIGSDTNWTDVWTTVQPGLGTSETSCLARKSNGTLWAWGVNASGQLGFGNQTTQTTPLQIGSRTTWITAGVGGNFSIAVAS